MLGLSDVVIKGSDSNLTIEITGIVTYVIDIFYDRN